MIKYCVTEFAFWLLKICKVNYFIFPREERQIIVEGLVVQVQSKFKDQSGEFKRSQVLRAAMNAFPKAEERELGLAIEIAVQKVKRV
jgi:hypothetical protein